MAKKSVPLITFEELTYEVILFLIWFLKLINNLSELKLSFNSNFNSEKFIIFPERWYL